MTDTEVQALRELGADSLMLNTKDLVQKETSLTLKVLFHIQEIERRRIHFDRGYSSLHEFCVRYLGYSDGSASRRIQAARLLKEIPELETKIEKGEISLTVAAQAQSFFYSERKENRVYTKEQKQELLLSLENKSSKEAEREFLKLSPENLPREKVRQLTETSRELRVVLDQEMTKEFEELKSWLSHKIPHASFQDLIRASLKIANRELRKKRLGAEAKTSAPSAERLRKAPEHWAEGGVKRRQQHESGLVPRSRAIPVHIRRSVWGRDQGSCSYVDPKTGRLCASKVRLELDHYRMPFGKGGEHTAENIRLSCRQHNIQTAIQHYGISKISQWVELG